MPVVVFTGQQGRIAGVAALNAGAQDYLEKNELSSSTLWRSIRFAVERQQSAERGLALLGVGASPRREQPTHPGTAADTSARMPMISEWASKYSPASEQALLGGDFIDAIESADGSVRVVIGDVSGHGPEEAALGAALRIGWRSLVLSGADQSERSRISTSCSSPSGTVRPCSRHCATSSIDSARATASRPLGGPRGASARRSDGAAQLVIDAGPVIGLGLGHRHAAVDRPPDGVEPVVVHRRRLRGPMHRGWPPRACRHSRPSLAPTSATKPGPAGLRACSVRSRTSTAARSPTTSPCSSSRTRARSDSACLNTGMTESSVPTRCPADVRGTWIAAPSRHRAAPRRRHDHRGHGDRCVHLAQQSQRSTANGSPTATTRPWWRRAELLAAVVDQETGVRGFVLSGERSFLEPWSRSDRSTGAGHHERPRRSAAAAITARERGARPRSNHASAAVARAGGDRD